MTVLFHKTFFKCRGGGIGRRPQWNVAAIMIRRGEVKTNPKDSLQGVIGWVALNESMVAGSNPAPDANRSLLSTTTAKE